MAIPYLHANAYLEQLLKERSQEQLAEAMRPKPEAGSAPPGAWIGWKRPGETSRAVRPVRHPRSLRDRTSSVELPGNQVA